MSYTTVEGLWRQKRTVIAELANSWLSAPLIWEAYGKRYFGCKESYEHPGKGWMQRIGDMFKGLSGQSIPKGHRAVLMMTGDRCYVTKGHFKRMAEDIDGFMKDLAMPHKGHWPAIARLMREGKAPAIGLWCTSVSEDPWLGPYDEEKDRHRRFDWDTAFPIYESLDEEERKAGNGFRNSACAKGRQTEESGHVDGGGPSGGWRVSEADDAKRHGVVFREGKEDVPD